jgi:uncharacterized repeat protein (TIGR03803 family)
LRLRLRAKIAAAVFAVMSLLAAGAAQRAQAQTFTVVHSFTRSDGSGPMAGLLLDAAGNLYGTTLEGGTFDEGTVFKVDPSGNETVLHNFTSSNGAGAYPLGGLVMDAAGNLYGTTQFGGSSNDGTVFKLDTSGNETVLHSFADYDGGNPGAGLIMDAAGNLYGTTRQGGLLEAGTVFKLDTSGTETVLYSFGSFGDGAHPAPALIMDKAGNLYGTTVQGGTAFNGTVFKLDISGNETVLHSFTGNDGGSPLAALVMDAAGNLYGTTNQGGANGSGTVFELGTSGTETVLHSFAKTGGDGWSPVGSLVMDAAGKLYGTTQFGGADGGAGNGAGSVFKLDTSDNETVLHSFGSSGDGANPVADLIMDKAGNLYGTTVGGGANGYGTVFKLTFSVPFTSFTASLAIVPPGFRLNGAFTTGPGAAPIDLATQDLTLKVGTYTVTIPAGSFRAHPKGSFTYAGAIDGARLEIRIAAAGADAYKIRVEASRVHLTTLTNPVPVTLTFGNNTGTAEVTAEFHPRPD